MAAFKYGGGGNRNKMHSAVLQLCIKPFQKCECGVGERRVWGRNLLTEYNKDAKQEQDHGKN